MATKSVATARRKVAFRLKRQTKRNTKYPLLRLPYWGPGKSGNLFSFPEVDGYGAGCELGAAAAQAYLTMMRRSPEWNGGSLQQLVLSALEHCNQADYSWDTADHGKRGIVVGFFSNLDNFMFHAMRLVGSGYDRNTDDVLNDRLSRAARMTSEQYTAKAEAMLEEASCNQ